MEALGGFIIALLITMFFILGFVGVVAIAGGPSLFSEHPGCRCTQSAVVSPKDVKPAVEACVQYTKQAIK